MIPTYRPTIRRADMDAVLRRLAEDSIGAGTLSREFSQSIAKYVGKRGGVSLRSYGRAVAAAIKTLELEPGARIGVSALAPVSVYNMIEQTGAVPVVIDSDRQLPVLPSPLDFDYAALELAALIVDTRLGYVPDLENLRQLSIPLIEDISEGLGGHTGAKSVGSYGELTVVALEPEHIITAGGGAVVLSNSTRRIGALNRLVDARIGEPPLPDMNAALGLTQMKQVESFLERRRELAARFVKVVQRGSYRVPLQGGDGENVFFGLPIMVDSSPRDVEKYAQSHGVTALRPFLDVAATAVDAAVTGEPPEGGEGSDGEDVSVGGAFDAVTCPNAIAFASQLVVFPVFPTLTKTEHERIERVLATLP